ncbi:tRNA pseudouridine synthase A 1 [Chlamydiales bacterium STE3]|nr:tRNA pseudouridine synthase A 1 [Chlamydiales bacterium STE3]
MVYNYKMVIAYDGTDFHGWQIQPNGLSIQQLIEEKLAIILRAETKVVGSGRTDAGVHALGQTAHFLTAQKIDCRRVLGSLNGLLPSTIRILCLEEVSLDFHAQYSAKAKIYRYHLFLDKIMNPFRKLYCWHMLHSFSVELLEQGSRYFLGRHDFTSFANEAHLGVAARDPVRTVQRISIVPEEGGLYLEFEADGFLYKMVRNMVGTLVEVGLKKRTPQSVAEIFEQKNRSKAGIAAPPQGLFLVRVLY